MRRDKALKSLLRDGFSILDKLVAPELIARLAVDLSPRFAATPFCQGGFYGERTKRFGALLKRSSNVAPLVMHPVILDIVQSVLGPYCDRWQLNLTQALQLHPGQIAQIPHRDEDMWRGEKGAIEYLVNVMWPLSPYTAENGATLVYPRSCNGGDARDGSARPVAVEMTPGSALLYLGSALHGGGANRSTEVRTGMIVSYALGWLKPFENQWLVYPPKTAKRFPSDLAALVGYRQSPQPRQLRRAMSFDPSSRRRAGISRRRRRTQPRSRS